MHRKELRMLSLHQRVESDVEGLQWNHLVQKFNNMVYIAGWDQIEKGGLQEQRQEKTSKEVDHREGFEC
jgi:hypothetical protein